MRRHEEIPGLKPEHLAQLQFMNRNAAMEHAVRAIFARSEPTIEKSDISLDRVMKMSPNPSLFLHKKRSNGAFFTVCVNPRHAHHACPYDMSPPRHEEESKASEEYQDPLHIVGSYAVDPIEGVPGVPALDMETEPYLFQALNYIERPDDNFEVISFANYTLNHHNPELRRRTAEEAARAVRDYVVRTLRTADPQDHVFLVYDYYNASAEKPKLVLRPFLIGRTRGNEAFEIYDALRDLTFESSLSKDLPESLRAKPTTGGVRKYYERRRSKSARKIAKLKAKLRAAKKEARDARRRLGQF